MDFTNIGNASLETRRRRVQVLDFSEGGFATPLFEGNQGSEQPGKKYPAPGTPLDFVARGMVDGVSRALLQLAAFHQRSREAKN